MPMVTSLIAVIQQEPEFVKTGGTQMEPRPKKLLDQVRDALRLKHYSIRTEDSYVNWIRRYILFHGKRHPNEMGAAGGDDQ